MESAPVADVFAAPTRDVADDTADLGFLDYMELIEEANARLLGVLGRLSSAIETVGRNAAKRTAEVDSLTRQPNVANARLIFEQSARDLNEFSTSIISEIPQLAQTHTDLLNYVAGGAASALDFGASGKEQVSQVLTQLDTFSEVVENVRGITAGFRKTLAGLPCMTVLFNKAKRRASEALDQLDSTYAGIAARNMSVRADLADILVRSEKAH